MKHPFLLFALCLCLSVNAQDNIGINTGSPDPSALVDMVSTNRGLLVPRMTGAQRTAIPSPAAGLLVYQTDSPPGVPASGFYFFNGIGWHKLGETTLRLEDADKDTRILVEESPDQDQVHFFLGGVRGLSIKADSVAQRSRLEFPTNGGAVGIGRGALGSSATAGMAVGDSALAMNANGIGNLAFGGLALQHNTTGDYNLAFGAGALQQNDSGNFNTAFGSLALFANTLASGNTATGFKALVSNTTGTGNTAFGAMSMPSNTTGLENTAVGFRIMSQNAASSQHTAAGSFALRSNTSGQRNTAIGFNAAGNTSSGSDIVAIGYNALAASGSQSAVTAIGAGALGSLTTGAGNTAFGFDVLAATTTGEFNTGFGYRALSANVAGNRNTAFGHESLLANLGSRNTGFGHRAMADNLTGNANTALGFEAGLALRSGSDNTLIGYRANVSSDSLDNVTVIGDQVTGMEDNTVILGDASHRVGIGTNDPASGAKLDLASTTRGLLLPNVGSYANLLALPNTTNANGLLVFSNTYRSLYVRHSAILPGWRNLNHVFQQWMTNASDDGMIPISDGTTFVPGYPDAIRDLDGNSRIEIERNPDEDIFRLRLGGNERLVVRKNDVPLFPVIMIEPKGLYDCLFVGLHAGESASTGENNTGIGVEALRELTTGERNTALGFRALRDNTTGNRNTAAGAGALRLNQTGSRNVAVGRNALDALVTGSDNVAIGAMAGDSITSQDLNTVIGYLADISGNITNATALGYRARVTASNALVIGSVEGVNGAPFNALVGMGTSTPQAQLHVARFNSEFGAHLLVEEETDGFGRIKMRNAATAEEWSLLARRTPLAANARFNLFYGQNILSIEGDGDASLAGILVQSSDRRLKQDIRRIDFDWDRLADYNLVTYHWADASRSAGRQIGVVAQALEPLFPELVNETEGGVKAVNYLGMVPYVLEGTKATFEDSRALDQQAIDHARQLAELRAEINALHSLPGSASSSAPR